MPPFSGSNVFLTGHTGFKGAWLCEWLLSEGAVVTGYALPPSTKPSLFAQLGLAERIHANHYDDIRDRLKLEAAIREAQPDFLFHLAAQPLVLDSYARPRETFETNIMGTLHVLEALRRLDAPCAAVLVSSDKCYHNDDSGRPFRETDPMGGIDPYSASKGAMEIAVHSYRRAYFTDTPVKIASARAGNVIGGGDYAADRIIPDIVRAQAKGEVLQLRNPAHTRPWQHVLEPLSGYRALALALASGWQDPDGLFAFNFGPSEEGQQSVAALADAFFKTWPGGWKGPEVTQSRHEAALLALSIEKAKAHLQWHPRWDFDETVRRTARWYKQVQEGGSALEETQLDLAAYVEA
jgi:CDP-glucose 4,6-dehydratase